MTPVAPRTAALAGALLLAAAVGIGRFAYTPLLPPMRDALGWSVAQAGDVAAANFIGYVLGALAAAAVTQGARRRRWLVAAFVASAATTLVGAGLESFAAWLAVRFLAGVASAFCLVLGTAVVIEFAARCGAPQWGALHFAGVGAGIVASVLVIELARSLGGSLVAQWAALGLAAAALLAAAWTIVRRLPTASPLTAPGGAASAPAPLGRLIAAYGLFGFGYVVMATFIVEIARRLEHTGSLEAATWIAVGLLAAPSVVVWQRIARRRGLYAALRIAYAVEAAGVLLAGFAAGPAAVVLGGALLGATFMGITALGLVAARARAGANSDRALGWMTASFGLGQLLGPAVAGRIAEATGGFQWPGAVAGALLVVGIVLLRGLERD